jgi:hypothetical protein
MAPATTIHRCQCRNAARIIFAPVRQNQIVVEADWQKYRAQRNHCQHRAFWKNGEALQQEYLTFAFEHQARQKYFYATNTELRKRVSLSLALAAETDTGAICASGGNYREMD